MEECCDLGLTVDIFRSDDLKDLGGRFGGQSYNEALPLVMFNCEYLRGEGLT